MVSGVELTTVVLLLRRDNDMRVQFTILKLRSPKFKRDITQGVHMCRRVMWTPKSVDNILDAFKHQGYVEKNKTPNTYVGASSNKRPESEGFLVVQISLPFFG